jgi:hypothetical protein
MLGYSPDKTRERTTKYSRQNTCEGLDIPQVVIAERSALEMDLYDCRKQQFKIFSHHLERAGFSGHKFVLAETCTKGIAFPVSYHFAAEAGPSPIISGYSGFHCR